MSLRKRRKFNIPLLMTTGVLGGGGVAPLMPFNSEAILDLYYDMGTFQDTGGATPATTGQDVALWQDQSSGSNDGTQTTGANRPTVAAGGINFVAADTNWLDFTGITNSASNYTVVARFTQNTFTGVEEFFFDIQTGRLVLSNNVLGSTFRPGYFDSSWKSGGSGTVSTTGDTLLVWVLSSTSPFIRRNKATLSGALAYTQRAIGGTVRMGVTYNTALSPINLTLKHWCIIPRALTLTEVQRVEAWSTSRFGPIS